MVNVGFRVSAVLVFAVGVTVYGYAGDSQLIHYYFVGSGIASADCFAFYKSAVRCVDISRGDVVGVVFIVISNVIVFDFFGKNAVYFLGKICVSCGVSIGCFKLVYFFYNFVYSFIVFYDCFFNRRGGC